MIEDAIKTISEQRVAALSLSCVRHINSELDKLFR